MLQACLAAVAAQTARPARVLVVDNASSDGSIERCQAAFPWVEYHRLDANVGFARANNIAAKIASDCEWLALLNPDAFPDRGWIESFLAGASAHPDVHVFASCMLSEAHSGLVDGAGDIYRVDGIAWPRLQFRPVGELPRQSEEVFSACAGAAFYRAAAFWEAGGFSERYFCYHEDVDLGFRLRLLGYRCVFLPRAIVRHVGSAVAGRGSEFSIYHVHRNIVWTYVKNMPGLYFWAYLPAHLMANVASLAWLSATGRGRVAWRAKRDALRALPQVWRERLNIQSKRRASPRAIVQQMERGNVISSARRRLVAALRHQRQQRLTAN